MSLEEKAQKLVEAEKEHAHIDWNAERNWWVSTAKALYQQIDEWLTPLREKGLVASKRTPVSLTEEHIGTYEMDALVLEFGRQGIVLEPKGTLIVGARGRIDVYRRGARSDQVMLILGGSKDVPKWEIWPNRNPRERKPMNQASFESLLETFLEV